MGITSCLGNTLEDVTDSLKNCKSGITFSEKYEELGLKSRVCGRPTLTEDDFKKLIDVSAKVLKCEERAVRGENTPSARGARRAGGWYCAALSGPIDVAHNAHQGVAHVTGAAAAAWPGKAQGGGLAAAGALPVAVATAARGQNHSHRSKTILPPSLLAPHPSPLTPLPLTAQVSSFHGR